VQPSAGDKLGPYEIIAQIGAGGMGVVYRARDPRVGRDVAIKVSSEHFSDRFEREARAVAALNHANVCTLHDVGPNYLVMELVEGEPPKGPLPFQTALDYARQIADALDAAHEKGIVHRDLKPGNIRIRSDGTVKVLDFGLAKIDAGGTSAENPSNSPTMLLEGTQAGMILGTAAYMSPEQARGKPVDKRADIWAFGAVFYEMLTGRRAFEGEDVSTIIAAVIQSEPRWDGVPASVRRLLESCFEKDPRKRLRDIGDVWKLLDHAHRPAVSPSRSANVGWIAAAALAVIAAIALWAPWRRAPREAAPPLVTLDVDLGPDVSLLPLVAPTFSSLIISPDGRRLVFVGSVSGGSSRLFARRLDESRITELAGTEGALNPFFSPDGQWLAFWNGGKLSKVSLEGGAVVPLADLDVMTGGSWADDGSLVVGSRLPDATGLVRIPPGGGTPAPLVKLASGELFLTFPQILPGRNAVLIAVVGTPPSIGTTNIDIVSLDDGRRKTLVRGGTSPRYLPSGHLVYAGGAGMFAVPVDIDRLETRGAAVPILGDAAFDPLTGGAQFDVARNGTLVYRKNFGGAGSTTMLVQWIDRAGKREPLLGKPGAYGGAPRLSPDDAASRWRCGMEPTRTSGSTTRSGTP
jgi:serine/threonine protein kinase